MVINAQIYALHLYAWKITAYPALEKDSQRAHHIHIIKHVKKALIK